MTETKHIVWSNIDLDLDDWYDDLHEQYPALGEEGLRDMMYELNFEYFGDEQRNLDIDVGTPILVLGDLGLWDGRHKGYGEIQSGNLKDCMEACAKERLLDPSGISEHRGLFIARGQRDDETSVLDPDAPVSVQCGQYQPEGIYGRAPTRTVGIRTDQVPGTRHLPFQMR